jgi:hypothetical protein
MLREQDIEDLEVPDDETLLAYTEQFVGVGVPFAPFWFVWSGPAYPAHSLWNRHGSGRREAREWSRAERFRLLTVLDRWTQHRSAVRRFEELYGLWTGKYPYHAR